MSRFTHLQPGDYALSSEDLDRILTPALVIHLDKVRNNIQSMLGLLGGDPDRWRPHVKTAKIPRIFEEYVAHGISRFKCATPREASCLVEVLKKSGGAEGDVIVAYPLVGPALRQVADLARGAGGIRLSVLCENAAHVQDIPESLGIFVDLNPGMNRTGIPMTSREVILEVAQGAGDRFRGVHYYEGHLRQPDPQQRRASAFPLYDELLNLVAWLKTTGVEVEELVTSGTPGFPAALDHPGLAGLEGTSHRISPGTVVYHDMTTDEIVPEIELTPAAVVVSRVVSQPAAGTITLDAGSKSIAAEAGNPCAFVIGHPHWEPKKPSEEHLPVSVKNDELPRRGTVVYLVPRHVCPTVNLAEEAVLVEDGRLVDVVPVSARAHDTILPSD